MYEIESGVPVPKKVGLGAGRKGKSKYPFARMVNGDSFRAPACQRISLTAACSKWNREHGDSGTRLTVRKVDDEFVGVWCVTRSPSVVE